MKYLFYIISLLLLIFTSCNKDEIGFEFSGNIKSSVNASNLDNVEVKIYTYSLGNGVEKLAASTTTDASGNYEASIERDKFEKVVMTFEKNNYFKVSQNIPFDDLSTENTNEYNKTIDAKSWTKFIIKNNSPSDGGDELKLQKASGKNDCDNCWSNGNKFFNGVVDTSFYVPNSGGSYMKFYWWSYGNTTLHAEDSVYNEAFDTTSYTINY
ncbi:hypothetical protein [Brumimicrobium aurantiacum]|uniref:Uncharacterized protein n=1 Tax=Brumimicrobium aurantiacum TaxID=1737063 RepID=A0A3E1EW50_9FLAO|nr:hypothetical protein [Brumimicrobium aurantiacum]RFC53748.1 hypothetical protein DXU93_11515 [Brumimicrobium aurantiacum]